MMPPMFNQPQIQQIQFHPSPIQQIQPHQPPPPQHHQQPQQAQQQQQQIVIPSIHHGQHINIPNINGSIQHQQHFANQMNDFAQQITAYSQQMVQYGQALTNVIQQQHAQQNNNNNNNNNNINNNNNKAALVWVDNMNGIQNAPFIIINNHNFGHNMNMNINMEDMNNLNVYNDDIIDLTEDIDDDDELDEFEEEEFVPWNDEDIPDEFKCPISLEIMSDPVLCSDGFYYERECLGDKDDKYQQLMLLIIHYYWIKINI